MRPIRTALIRSAAAAALALALGACSDDGGDDDASATTEEDAGAVVVPVGTTGWDPAELEVSVGESVRWSFAGGSAPHSVKSVGEGPLDSGSAKDDGEYSFAFAEAGTYEYVCGVHPAMEGTIVVS